MEYAIGEIRRRRFHKDMEDPSILSRAELEKIAIRRGVWSKEDSNKSLMLQQQIGQIMGALDSVGYHTVDEVLTKYNATIQKLFVEFDSHERKDEIMATINRYFDLDNDEPNPEDHTTIFKAAPNSNVEEHLSEARLYRTQIKLLQELQKARAELEPLLVTSAKLFKDSIEMRADREEALAKLYYCVKQNDKPLWPSFENMLDVNPRDLELLMEDMYFFERGIPDKDRTVLGRHGFTLRAPIEATSDDSQGSPLPNSNGESQPNELISSSETQEPVTSA
jgi:hypothetical protein